LYVLAAAASIQSADTSNSATMLEASPSSLHKSELDGQKIRFMAGKGLFWVQSGVIEWNE
jgi:hypothetical protein